ncbi:MAG TPA: substrate-binding domain-containing protein, partial [Thermoflexales bacterium]|nr:substrate-binding domain-containing protein [Thermoflexales bacterium]
FLFYFLTGFVILALEQMLKIKLADGDPQPLYKQIAFAIRDQIARGDLRPGDSLPTVRDLARQLAINPNTVVRAYNILNGDGVIEAHSRQGTRVTGAASQELMQASRQAELRLMASRFIGESLARGFTPAEVEAAFLAQGSAWQDKYKARVGQGAQWIGLGSHDLCLEVLLSQCQQTFSGLSFSFGAVGSVAGLIALSRGEAHFATSHMLDPKTGDYNLSFVKGLMPNRQISLITLAFRAQGFIVAKGNPHGIRSAQDLTRHRVRLINRQVGAGTRALLDHLLGQAELKSADVRGYASEARTHFGVTAAIQEGRADVGIGIEAAARAAGLDFVPITHERYELVLPADSSLRDNVQRVVKTTAFTQAVRALGGYDLSETGRVRNV